MKKILCILGIIAITLACNKRDDNKDDTILLDSNATLSVNLNTNIVKSRAYSKEDSSLLKNIIKTAYEQSMYDFSLYKKDTYLSINDKFRDTTNLRFLFWGIAVIVPAYGTLETQLGCLGSTSVNILFIKNGNTPLQADTIAYIPNAIVKSIHKRIKTAFNAKDYKECYRIFDSEYIAYPCTGEQYRKLVADGIEKPYLTGMIIESWYNDIYDDIYPQNSEYWQKFGVNSEYGQKWHRYWYGVNYPEIL